MTRQILSITVAVVVSALGYAAAWTGGTKLAHYAGAMRPVTDVVSYLLLILGVVLLAVATLTIVWSSAGVLAVGGIHVVIGLLALLFPPDGLGAQFVPAYDLIRSLHSLGDELSFGAYFTVPTGMGLVTGAALIAIGLGSRARARARVGESSQNMRILAASAATVIGLPAFVLVLAAGGVSYRATAVMLSNQPILAIVMIVLGAGLVAGVLYLTRWSSVGAVELGLVITVLGAIMVFAPNPSVAAVFGLSRELSLGIGSAGVSGNVLLVGVVITAAGIGAKLRSNRAPQASV